MKKKSKKKFRIKWQAIFNLFSFLFILTLGIYYTYRLVHYKLESEKEVVYSDILYERLIEDQDEYASNPTLVKMNGMYRYVGQVDNNYVKYKGFIWRIIKINNDNSIAMITEQPVTSLPYNDSIENTILKWLNKDTSENTGIFEKGLEANKELLNTKICTNKISDIESNGCFESTTDYKIGILGLYDYIEAGADGSYLNNETSFWTSNNYDTESSWYIAGDGKLSSIDNKAKLGIRPVITIDGETTIYSGMGTIDDPYIIEERKVETTKDLFVGDYINYSNGMWKVVSKENGKIKIVNETCIMDDEENCINKIFSNYNNKINLKDKKQLLYYLNNQYYNSLSNKEYITNGNFYSGYYSLTKNDYRLCMTSYTNMKVGVLSPADPFAYEVANTFLLTTSEDNDLSIYIVNDNNSLYESMVNKEAYVRPALYIKDNIEITEGTGDFVSPYELGELK